MECKPSVLTGQKLIGGDHDTPSQVQTNEAAQKGQWYMGLAFMIRIDRMM